MRFQALPKTGDRSKEQGANERYGERGYERTGDQKNERKGGKERTKVVKLDRESISLSPNPFLKLRFV